MQKILPIKLERNQPLRNTKIIDWRLSNVCNYNCSFCPSNFKDGSKKPLDFQIYINLINSLIDQDISKNVWFQFTGGEPTLYPKLIDLLKHIKNKNGYTSMISNGSRTIRWWQELADAGVLDRLYLSYHPEQAKDPTHIIDVNNLMQETNTFVSIFVTTQHHNDLFNQALTDFNNILEKANSICSLKPISDEENLQPYSPEQLKIIQKNLYVSTKSYQKDIFKKTRLLKNIPWYSSNVKLSFNNNTHLVKPAQYLVEHGLNKFKNWECSIGKDLLVIEINEVFRGMCREGGMIGDLTLEKINWMTDNIICQKNNCNCSLDVQEPKFNINLVDNL